MTIYLYRCEDGHEHEHDYPMGQAPASAGLCAYPLVNHPAIPDCGKPLNRVFSVPSIVHGHGFIGPGLAPWSDKVQKSVEGQERFGKGK